MSSQPSIFVQIPSYRDLQLAPTLLDMIENCSEPSMLRIVVCWQHGKEQDLRQFTLSGFHLIQTEEVDGTAIHKMHKDGASITLIDIHFSLSQGCGWARNRIQQHYNGESYNLQIDSHHRFPPNWDIKMTDLLHALKRTASKPILTGHPPAFDPETYPKGRQDWVGAIVFDSFSPIGLVAFKSIRIPRTHQHATFRARFVAGGFIFSEGSFVREVPSDPDQFFSTEEIAISVRAFSHGYDFFHPCMPLLWHQYHNSAPKVWDEDHIALNAIGNAEHPSLTRSETALAKTLVLVGLSRESSTDDMGVFGLGPIRTVMEYERYAGLSFALQGVRREAMLPVEPITSSYDINRIEWEKGLLCRRSIVIRISSDDPIELPSDLLVTSHATCGRMISLRELSSQELNTLSSSGRVELLDEVEAAPDNLPASYSIHSKSAPSGEGNCKPFSIEAIER